ncbi:MAG TPA: hypothetical protein GX697_03235, partial [Firmicutes bacterium]|nr:hypothetical protein [Bacillota bacterium]
DAVATATANCVQDKQDVEKAVQFALSVRGVLGALVIKEDMLAVRGAIKLLPLKNGVYPGENPGENIFRGNKPAKDG